MQHSRLVSHPRDCHFQSNLSPHGSVGVKMGGGGGGGGRHIAILRQQRVIAHMTNNKLAEGTTIAVFYQLWSFDLFLFHLVKECGTRVHQASSWSIQDSLDGYNCI